MSNKCTIEDCGQPVKGGGLCGKHYMRKRRTGSALMTRPPGTPGVMRKHFMYGAWAAMVNRCHNSKNYSFTRYGALGVTVCNRWRAGESGMTGFECFLLDMGERPDERTLDRIDGMKGYGPDNCRWASSKEQRANITPDGDKRMRDAISSGVRRYWEMRRKVQQTAAHFVNH